MKVVIAAAIIACVVPAATAQVSSSPGSVERQLRSPDPLARAVAFRSLEQQQRASLPRQLLLELLETENPIVVADAFVTEVYGEGYRDYYSELQADCYLRCDRSDPRVSRALAGGWYSVDSPMALQLAAHHSTEILPTILERSRSAIPGLRAHGIDMLGTISASPTTAASDHSAIR